MSNISDRPSLAGLVPEALRPRTRKIVLEGYRLDVDIGFHDFEIGFPQPLVVDIYVWVDEGAFAAVDEVDAAWNYDFLRSEIARLVAGRRFNLQETLVREVYALIASRHGVTGLKVSTRKTDVYPDCRGVGVELSSFAEPG